jgi:TfoX/Sxy family transcriptional regulator of competence genes
LNVPKLPFVIGVMGVGGPTDEYGPEQQRYTATHQNFRDAMAAPAKLPEFHGNVVSVLTEKYWDSQLSELNQRRESVKQKAAKQAKEQNLDPEAARQLEAQMLTEAISVRENELLKNGVSNAEYHYLGSARVLGGIGKGMAEAMQSLLNPPLDDRFTWRNQPWDETHYSLVRVWKKVVQTEEYKQAKTQSARLGALFNFAVKEHPYNFEKPIRKTSEGLWKLPTATEDPLSDRYVLTARGGTLDLVHLASQSAAVCAGNLKVEDAVQIQWEAEGGADAAAGKEKRADGEEFEANHDDLPSNALGALFGEEIRAHEQDLDFDLPKAFQDFLRPLDPLPDQYAKKFSHAEVVMGITQAVLPRADYFAQSKWFTAEPFLTNDWINRQLDERLGANAERLPGYAAGLEGLRAAGFDLLEHRGEKILIRRPSER